jgi:hypothetical protein
MANQTQPKFQFDERISRQLREIELIAELSPIAWSSLVYRGKSGEIAKFRRLKAEIEKNIMSLNKLLGDPETPKERFSLARSMRLQLLAQRDRAMSVIEAIQKSEVEKG